MAEEHAGMTDVKRVGIMHAASPPTVAAPAAPMCTAPSGARTVSPRRRDEITCTACRREVDEMYADIEARRAARDAR